MAQLERSECVPTRCMSIPSFSGPIRLTWAIMCDRICFAVIWTSLSEFGRQKVLTVDVGVVFLYPSTLFIVLAHALTGQRLPRLTLCWVMVSFLSPFFCWTNVIETHSALSRCVSGSSCGSSLIPFLSEPLKNLTPAHVMIFVFLFPSSLFVFEYSQDLIAKKSPPSRRAPCAARRGDVVSS